MVFQVGDPDFAIFYNSADIMFHSESLFQDFGFLRVENEQHIPKISHKFPSLIK
jgi:hypothetical protein